MSSFQYYEPGSLIVMNLVEPRSMAESTLDFLIVMGLTLLFSNKIDLRE